MIKIKIAEKKFFKCVSCINSKKVNTLNFKLEQSNGAQSINLCDDCLVEVKNKIEKHLSLNESDVEKINKIMGGPPKWSLEIVLNFGKHKGQSLGDIFAIDKGYLHWLEFQSFINAETKKAVKLILSSI